MALLAFDLDDTLFPEADYVASACRAVAARYCPGLLPRMLAAHCAREAFDIAASAGGPMERILDIYRTHRPDIRLPWQSLYTLTSLNSAGHTLALVTDGRSVTQRHKVEALGLKRFINDTDIFISEEWGRTKADGSALRRLSQMHSRCTPRIYVGDNPAKDFGPARREGWHTVCLLDSGRNIHPQTPPAGGETPPGWEWADREIHQLTELLLIANSEKL